MNETKATQLIDKFFEGATTLSEEQQLYDYFTSPNVGPELMPVRQMFLDMCQLQGCEPTPKAQVATHHPRLNLSSCPKQPFSPPCPAYCHCD